DVYLTLFGRRWIGGWSACSHGVFRERRWVGTAPPATGLVDFRDELRNDVEQVAHQAVVGHREDRRFRVLVDGDDGLRVLHAGQVLDRARDADRDVQGRGDDL